MKKFWVLLLFFLPLPAFAVTPAQFSQWLAEYSGNKENLLPAVQKKAATFQYALVSGFLNEFAPGYFGDNRETLIANGVPADSIHIYSPYSSRSVEENAETYLPEQFAPLAKKGKLVLIGHSKGAAEILSFALQNPKFVEKNVESIFLIQGAFGGSGLADYIKGEGHPVDDQMPWCKRFSFELKYLFALVGDAVLLGDGIESLTHKNAAEYWTKLKKTSTDAVATIGSKVYYIQSVLKNPDDASAFIRNPAWYMHTYYGPNDGLVELKDQYVPWVGTPLVIMDTDHTGLVVDNPISKAPKSLRETLTKAIATSL